MKIISAYRTIVDLLEDMIYSILVLVYFAGDNLTSHCSIGAPKAHLIMVTIVI